MKKDKRVIQVSSPSKTALTEPTFLIRHEGKLYLTVAVLEYDIKHKHITKDQERTIRELDKLIETGECVQAVPMMQAQSVEGANTDPGDRPPEL